MGIWYTNYFLKWLKLLLKKNFLYFKFSNSNYFNYINFEVQYLLTSKIIIFKNFQISRKNVHCFVTRIRSQRNYWCGINCSNNG